MTEIKKSNADLVGTDSSTRRNSNVAESYTGKAVLTLALYYFGFFLVGFVLNIVFLVDSNRTKRNTGKSPNGRGCLIILLLWHLIIPIIVIVLIVFGAFGAIISNS